MKLFKNGNYVIGVKNCGGNGWNYFYEDSTYGIETTNEMDEILVFESKNDAVNWWNKNKEIIEEKFKEENIKKISIRKFKDVLVLKEISKI